MVEDGARPLPEHGGDGGSLIAKIIELIEAIDRRGGGTREDPYRIVQQFWYKDGRLLCEIDPTAPPLYAFPTSEYQAVVRKITEAVIAALGHEDHSAVKLNFAVFTDAIRKAVDDSLAANTKLQD